MIGWFEGRELIPAHDPPLDGPCIVCAEQMQPPRVTISFARYEGGDRSYFFRAHKECWDALDADERGAYESSVIDRGAA